MILMMCKLIGKQKDFKRNLIKQYHRSDVITPNLLYAWMESVPGGNMDQKRYLSGDKLYIFGNKGYNFQEAGNIVWGAAMNYLNFTLEQSTLAAQLYTQLKYGTNDQPNEQQAIIVGWEKNQTSGKGKRFTIW